MNKNLRRFGLSFSYKFWIRFDGRLAKQRWLHCLSRLNRFRVAYCLESNYADNNNELPANFYFKVGGFNRCILGKNCVLKLVYCFWNKWCSLSSKRWTLMFRASHGATVKGLLLATSNDSIVSSFWTSEKNRTMTLVFHEERRTKAPRLPKRDPIPHWYVVRDPTAGKGEWKVPEQVGSGETRVSSAN